jgi:integrase
LNDKRDRGELVFPSQQGKTFSTWAKFKMALDKAIIAARANRAKAANTTPPPLVPWTLHDLRRTVATGLQKLGVRLEVTEAVLNHISGSRSGIAGIYQRHTWETEKRAALEAWAAHVSAVVSGRSARPKVVPLFKA